MSCKEALDYGVIDNVIGIKKNEIVEKKNLKKNK
jgi:ATP-dependent protease ClpP protease subunit